MIEVTRLNGKTMYLNCDLIEYIEATPDTIITMTSGKHHLVKEDVLTVVERIIAYQRRVHYVAVADVSAGKEPPEQPYHTVSGEEVQPAGEIESLPD